MFCSTVIPTIGRPTLARAVTSVLDQVLTRADFEIIVVNDSGQRLVDETWQQAACVRIVETQQHERSVARNTGAALARGKYLHFLDDDDWLLPGALERFWTLAQTAKAAGWLYGATQLVDRAGQPLLPLHHKLTGNCLIQTLAGEWIPLQASLIKTETFFDVGGFNPLLTGPEDIDLLRRIALHSDLAGDESLVACVGMGQTNSSTNQASHAPQSRWAREQILNQPGVLGRLHNSIRSAVQPESSAAGWHGRLLRIYLTSLLWNVQRGKLTTAISRAAFATAGLIAAGTHVVSAEFWRAIVRAYASETFRHGRQPVDPWGFDLG
ncbi:MAG: glycosyltransferase family 2 protein [Chloroflexota bacterium]|nr:glycosyltransferase family 2 protein [Chloroflexota bacterium]